MFIQNENLFEKEVFFVSKNNLSSNLKRTQGQYFTQYNPFENEGFFEWAKECDLKNQTVLEPFAGANNLIEMLKNME